MAESAEKKFLGMVAVLLGLFLTFLIVVTVLGAFTFNAIRAGNARIEANIAAMSADRKAGMDRLEAGIASLRTERKAGIASLRTERKAGIAALRADWRADIDTLSAKIDALDDKLGARLDESERERARTQGALEMLRARQAPNP